MNKLIKFGKEILYIKYITLIGIDSYSVIFIEINSDYRETYRVGCVDTKSVISKICEKINDPGVEFIDVDEIILELKKEYIAPKFIKFHHEIYRLKDRSSVSFDSKSIRGRIRGYIKIHDNGYMLLSKRMGEDYRLIDEISNCLSDDKITVVDVDKMLEEYEQGVI